MNVPRALIFVLGAVALGAFVPPAFATYPGANGEVIFQSSRDGDNEIYLLNGDGSGVTQLTTNSAADVNPVWSPDGQQIVFQSNRSGNADVWVMDADGSSPTQLTTDPGFDGSPTWSPDGTRIAFTSARDGDDEILAMDAGGGNEVQLTTNGATDEDPAWGRVPLCTPVCTSHVGRIAFTSDRDGNDEIYSMFDDGSDQTNLTNNAATDREASWWLGVDCCARIAYVTDRGLSPGDSDLDIWEMSSNGTTPGFITDEPGDEVAPAWAPDGNWIAYEKVGADREIYVARSSGQDSVNITNAPTNERAPDWQAVPATGGHVRPRGATPLRASLVIAYPGCTSPNRTHGPPLAFPSCASPTPSSPNVNVGNPLGSGTAAANMMGAVRFDVLPGVPGPPDDSDVGVSASITDVRCSLRNINIYAFPCGSPNAGQQNDYVGELQGSVDLRLTDRWNATVPAGGDDRATGQDMSIAFVLTCASTPSTTIGSACTATTSLQALSPGLVRDTKRAVWELGQVKVHDAGADGIVATTDLQSLFAVQGVFVP